MTPNESKVLTFLVGRNDGVASWAALRGQLVLSEGALTVIINSLKRHLLVEQDRLFYRITSEGRAALEHFVNPPAREPFAGVPGW